jgi:filamentous hemagglutinin family protein
MKRYLPLLLVPGCLLALPKDPTIESGNVHISSDHKKMVIEASDKAIINYSSFNIGKEEKVQLLQPSSSSSVLNRIRGNSPSEILGQLESNGKIFLVNPNGIYFGKDSRVNVGALIASTLDIASQDFLQDNLSFFLQDKDSKAMILNEGFLTSSTEGAIVLLAPHVRNAGSIIANAGKVLIASSEHVTLDFSGNNLISFAVEGEIKDALIEHLGTIQSNGGTVSLALPIAKKAIKETVNREGIECGEVFTIENGVISLVAASSIQAQEVDIQGQSVSVAGNIDCRKVIATGETIELKGAHIEGQEILIGGNYQGKGNIPYASQVSVDSNSSLTSDGGTIVLWSSALTEVAGKLSAKGESGGLIETSSLGKLSLSNDLVVDTSSLSGQMGSWLLDPSTIAINSSGGDIPPDCFTDTVIDVSNINSHRTNVTICADTIIQNAPISMTYSEAGITFISPGSTEGSLLLSEGITTNKGPISIQNMVTTLTGDVTLNTTGAPMTLGFIQSPADITLTLKAGRDAIIFREGVSLPKGSLNAKGGSLEIADDIYVKELSLTSISSINTRKTLSAISGPVLLNSLEGNIGEKNSPLRINTPSLLTIGGNEFAIMKGDPFHSNKTILFVPENRPCILKFHKKFLRTCLPVFSMLPKSLFRTNSSYNSGTLGMGYSAISFENHTLYSPFGNLFPAVSPLFKGIPE